jgi:hypothetical protein
LKFSFVRHRVGDDVVDPGERDRHKEQQPLRVGKVGTGDKDELMNFKGSLGWRSKGKDNTN